jgi:Flp pilus assembly protein TadG
MDATVPLGGAGRMALRDKHGVAALEFAIVAPVLIAMALSAYDIGNAVQQRMLLQQALRAGGQYAVSFPVQTNIDGSLDTNDIAQAVNQALPTGWLPQNPTVTFSPNPGSGPPYYVAITASRPFSPLLLTVIPDTAGSYVVRVQ